MRWFKHMTASADDEKLALVLDECGLTGYGFFWRVLEIIAAQVDESGKNYCAYTKRVWCNKLAINHQAWSKMIASCKQAGLFNVSDEGQLVKVEVGKFHIEFFTGEQQCKRTLDVSTYEWAELRAEIFRRDDYTCQYCGKRGVKLECDHVFPFSLGGQSTPENLVTACVSCNRSKGAKTLSEWRQ